VLNSICKISSLDDGLIRAEICREYRSYLIKTLSIVAKQKEVLLFTVNITRNRMQNPIMKIMLKVRIVTLYDTFLLKRILLTPSLRA
jgi:hypothetical protein